MSDPLVISHGPFGRKRPDLSPGPTQSATLSSINFHGAQIRSKIGQKIPPNVDVIVVSFLVPLGSLLASLWGPLGRPNRPKFGPRDSKIAPRRPQDRPRCQFLFKIVMFQKVLKSLRKINDFGSPRAAPNRPKMAPSMVKMA